MSNTRSKIVAAAGLALFLLGAAASARYAEGQGLIGQEKARQAVQIVIGLMLAGYANLMPKQLGRARASLRAEIAAQTALRVGGWSMTLAGLTYAAIWAFAPVDFAQTFGTAVIAAGLAVSLGFAAWRCMTCRAENDMAAGR